MMHRLFLAGALLATGAVASADTTIRTSSNLGGDATRDTLYIKDGKMRVDTGRDSGYMIFDSGAGTITVVQPSEQAYTVMTEENLRAMGDAVQNAMRQMEQQLANLPPQQREQVRQMMEQQMGAMMGSGGGPAPEPEIIRTGERKSIAGLGCEVVRIMVNGASKGSACMAPYSALGIPDGDRNTIESMVRFGQKLTEQFGDMVPAHMSAMAAEGYPIEYESSLGNTRMSGRLEGVETGSLSSDLFQVPAGFSQRSMPNLPGG